MTATVNPPQACLQDLHKSIRQPVSGLPAQKVPDPTPDKDPHPSSTDQHSRCIPPTTVHCPEVGTTIAPPIEPGVVNTDLLNNSSSEKKGPAVVGPGEGTHHPYNGNPPFNKDLASTSLACGASSV